MLPNARRASVPLLVVLALLVSVLLVLARSEPAAAGSNTGKVRGNIVGTQGGNPKVKVAWFTKDWKFIDQRKAYHGVYYLTLPPGTYWLQFTDQRPTYDVTKYAPTDIKVTVRANHSITKTVKMRPGAAITGTVLAGGKKAGGARIVAADASERSYATTANKKGQFALGGLPAGSYSVFTYDRKKQWVGKSDWVPKLKPGDVSNLPISLKKKAGGLLVDLYAGGATIKKRVFVTAVSKKTGQFWTARAAHGSVAFEGLFPGRYRVVVPDVGNYFGRTGAVRKGRVRPGRAAFGSFRLNQRGGWVSGIAVDGEDSSYPLAEVRVRLFDAAGSLIDTTVTGDSGFFRLGGALRTSTGWTVVADPDPANGTPYLGEDDGVHRCKYGAGEIDAIAVESGQGTDAGPVLLPHLAQQDRPSCDPTS